MKDYVLLLAGVVIVAISIVLVGESDYNAAEQEEKTYCEMVDIHDASGGINGWPPYNPSINCKE
jgi:hypothetical protein